MSLQGDSPQFDVVILGSGIAGSILATILAKHGSKVLMLDKASHPRFAIGEALTTHTEKLFSLLSHQYAIPEFKYLTSFDQVNQNIPGSSCGLKHSFNFLYHRQGQPQSSSERVQLAGTRSTHLFRQDVDYYLVQVAERYGARLFSNVTVTDIDIDEHGVGVKLEDGRKIDSSYIVDASGFSSILAKKFGFKEQPSRFKTKSRTLFTHMTGVKDIDGCLSEDKDKVVPWNAGTIHHVFDGGWMWVIPFNNHEHSKNPVCSVGLNLNLSHFPKSEDTSPEQEFKHFLSKFPTIADQFANAQNIRPWAATGRIQFSSSKCMGERFYILPHASGFIDPIFSTGLIQSLIAISPLAALILQAVQRNDYGMKNFASLEQLQQKIFDHYDSIANSTYISFKDFSLMNSWLRVWLLQHTMSLAKLLWEPLQELAIEDRNGYVHKDLSRFTEIDYLNAVDPALDNWGNDYIRKVETELEKVEAGLISSDEAVSRILSLLHSTSWFCKVNRFIKPSHRYVDILHSPWFYISLLAYSFYSQLFLKKEVRPFKVSFKNTVNELRWGIEV
ncbi:MAG: NAD(P)-binding protein [Cyanothece sp. SIO2G6]|nr:NAD(P)-binding protein [Cyanothece sp. SIO2G6]